MQGHSKEGGRKAGRPSYYRKAFKPLNGILNDISAVGEGNILLKRKFQ
jgi:hypothetical protein